MAEAATSDGQCEVHRDDQQLHLSGHLDLDTVPGLYRDTMSMFSQAKAPLIVDLSAIDYADSSGLALMLEWHSMAPADSKPVFTRVPEHLTRLVHLSRAGKLLDLDQA